MPAEADLADEAGTDLVLLEAVFGKEIAVDRRGVEGHLQVTVRVGCGATSKAF